MMKECMFEILENGFLNESVSLLVLGGDTSGISAPGQFVSVRIPGFFLRRPISVCDADGGELTLIYKTVGSGTNAERMQRQSVYMRGVVDRIHERLSDNSRFASDLVSAFHSIAVTDLTDQRLMEEIGKAHSYEVMPVDYLPGHYEQDSDGFVEFYPRQDSSTSIN